jgi:hypothetical protein
LVASASIDVPATDVITLESSVLPDIDDFLLIASFAAKQKTACLGWEAGDKYSLTKFYRGNYVFPELDSDESRDTYLIEYKDFETFMQVCYSEFLNYENKLAIRNAIWSVVPSQPSVLETTFLRVFAGLEALVLDFRRREDLEFVVSQSSWPSLKKYLKECIKKSTNPQLQPEQRASIYRKLDELNRVSLREAFEQFCIVLLCFDDCFFIKTTGVVFQTTDNAIAMTHGVPMCCVQ